MSPDPDEVEEWLQNAKDDLFSAQILIENEPTVPETACFHCQQAVENLLKAFLVWKAVYFEKVHSLPYLLDLCEVQESGFASLREKVEALAPYAVEIRYPGKVIEVSSKEAREALATAESVWDFVLSFLPDESYPSSRK